jgi:coproporphyrinogen III oxidase-like Fe-S oxidoreductase
MRRYCEAGFRFNSAYFGGGTPTTEPDELIQTIESAKQLFGVKEISVETNPKDLRSEVLRSLHDTGVTRLSVGVQSFDDRLLKDMGRFETYGSGAEMYDHLQAAGGLFSTLNVDLIFNQPRQDVESLRRDLQIVRSTRANQVSLYPLMSSNSVTQRMRSSTGIPDHRRLRELYAVILSELAPEFRPASTWCFTRGGQSNDEYIVNADFYVGIGSGAFSNLDGALYVTTSSLQKYQHRIAEGLTGITARSRLSLTDQMRYDLLVKIFGLRLDRRWALQRHGPRFFRRVWGELRMLEWLGAAKRDVEGWVLTERGMSWLVLVMSAFFVSVNEYRDAMRRHVIREFLADDRQVQPDLRGLPSMRPGKQVKVRLEQ